MLTQLPDSLCMLYLANNRFSGALELTRLPLSLTSVFLHQNPFSGTVDLSQLPRGLEELYLSNNKLSGEIYVPDTLYDRVFVESTNIIKRHME